MRPESIALARQCASRLAENFYGDPPLPGAESLVLRACDQAASSAAWRDLGYAALARRHWMLARDCLRVVATEHRNDADVLAMLARALRHCEQADEALEVAKRGARLAPGSRAMATQLGLARLALGQVDEAEKVLARAALPPDAAGEAILGLARCRLHHGDVAAAEDLLSSAARQQESRHDALLQLVDLRRTQERWPEAGSIVDSAVREWPASTDWRLSLAIQLNEMNLPEAAREALWSAAETGLASTAQVALAGNVALRLGEVQILDRCAEHLRDIDPASPDAQCFRAWSSFFKGMPDVAVDILAALNAAPGVEDRYGVGLAQLLLESAQPGRAREVLARTAARHGETALGSYLNGVCALFEGDYASGFARFAMRHSVSRMAAAMQPDCRLWRGEPLAGKSLLILSEQGLGDIVQMLRFIPRIAALGARVLAVLPPPALPLARAVGGIAAASTRLADVRDADYFCPIMNLPHALAIETHDLPGTIPYLEVPVALREAWRAKCAPLTGLKVGLCWSGSANTFASHLRDVPERALAPLAAVSGVTFVNLQWRPADQAAPCLPAGPRLWDAMDEVRDLADTAALIAQLDLVISVDSVPVHLAGALNRNTWLLCRYGSEWRWMLNREDSLWYPTVTVFRQSATRDWAETIARVAACLRQRASLALL